MMGKILKYLGILQVVSNDERHEKGLKRLGHGYYVAERLNKWNPLSYIFLLIVIVITLISIGVLGLYEESYNPFDWK